MVGCVYLKSRNWRFWSFASAVTTQIWGSPRLTVQPAVSSRTGPFQALLTGSDYFHTPFRLTQMKLWHVPDILPISTCLREFILKASTLRFRCWVSFLSWAVWFLQPVFIHSLPIRPASVCPKGHSTSLNPNTQSVLVLAWPKKDMRPVLSILRRKVLCHESLTKLSK